MGCICSKGTQDDQTEVTLPDKSSVNSSAVTPKKTVDEHVVVSKEAPKPFVIDRQPSKERNSYHHHKHLSGGTEDNGNVGGHVPNGCKTEYVVAGWPPWLASVAGDAIKGWLPRKADSFEKLDKIGQGTYSSVHRARDLETGKIVALKKVRFVNADPESVRFMAREIHILRSLDHPNIIKLEGLITSEMSSSLYLVFEYMEHDLTGIAAIPGIKFTEPQVKCYIQQLLRGLDHCHSRGVLHRDIKGSNLLIDNDGTLRIADFGLATFYRPDQKQLLTSRVVTLWYRPPELLLGATEYGVSVDLWSSGCILAELLAGKPIMPGRTEVEQMHKIYKLCGSPSEEYWRKSKLPHATIFRPQHQYKRCVREVFKDFPSTALDLLDVLLSVKPEDRGTATSALNSEFFTTKPFACDPSSLPNYPPSKEFDAKLRDEARRQEAAAVKARGSESVRSGIGVSTRMAGRDVISKFEVSLQKKHEQTNLNGPVQNGISHSSSMVHPRSSGSSWINKVKDDDHGSTHFPTAANGSELKSQKLNIPANGNVDPIASNTRSDNPRDRSTQGHWPDSRYNQLDVVEASEMQEWPHHGLERPASSHKRTQRVGSKDASLVAYGNGKNRIHYSGPLMPPGGNLEEMLKEHERQIQQAVRKARLDKTKTKSNYENKACS